MYLAELKISNFRKIHDLTLRFQPGLNVLVGANNIGKSAVVDALRALLAGHEEAYPRFSIEDRHRARDGQVSGDITFNYVFRGLSKDDEADFIGALVPDAKDKGLFEAHIGVRYADIDNVGRFRVKRWCGVHEDVVLNSDMMENLRGVYLQPLRDVSQGLRPSRNSQLSRLLQLLSDATGREAINTALCQLDQQLKSQSPIINTQSAILSRHENMLPKPLMQKLEVGLSTTDFQRLASRLSLSVDDFEIEQNGLGYNNLIFMAVVLSELATNPDASYRGLIVEEPEAHLHPQLQAILLRYLESLQEVSGEKPIQLFVTSHSPNFASIANLNSLICLMECEGKVEGFFPRETKFEDGKREKLERYLDVTRAELFFARRVIFVEGAAELMLVDILAKKSGYDLRSHGVSLISVDGLNFDSFLPLFGENALKIPVSVITDADPQDPDNDEESSVSPTESPGYPSLGDTVTVSDNTAKMKRLEDRYIQVHHGVKTFEYDLALHSDNREIMLIALAEIHPRIAASLRSDLMTSSDQDKAKILYSGMFERGKKNVQKGRFGQALAKAIMDCTTGVTVPPYIRAAIQHACQNEAF